MAASETARLIATLELKDLFTKQVDSATKSLGKLDKSIDSTQGRAYKAGQQIGTGIKRGAAIAVGAFGFLAANVALGVKSLEDLEKVTTQTATVLRSTKDASGQTAAGIRQMATEFEALNATMDDTVIQSGANVLLTFTNIREKAFKPALQAALNLSTAMGQDLQTSVVQIGKALNDPIKGLTSLTRVGVTFTEKQKDQIKQLVKANDVYGAQKIIIGELDREFGGSFLGQGQTTAGKFAKVKDAVNDLQRALATALLPALGKIATALSKTLSDPAVIAGVQKLGEEIAGLFSDQNLASAAGAVQGFIRTVTAAAPILEASAKATLGFVQAAVAVFNTLPDPLKALLVGGFALNKLTGGLVTNIAGGLADLLGKSRGASPANPVWVQTVGGGLGGAAGTAGGLIGGAAGLASVVIPTTLVAAAIAAVGDQAIRQNQQGLAAKVDAALAGQGDFAATQKEIAALLHEAQAGHLGEQQVEFLRSLNAKLEQGIKVQPTADARQAGAILDRGGREKGFSELAGKFHDDVSYVADLLKNLSTRFHSDLDALRHSTDPKAVASAIKDLEDIMVAQGHGSVQQTKDTIHALTERLKRTHDPTLQAALKTAIHDLKEKVPGREYAQRQIAKADSILRSGRSTEEKLRGLQAIERDLKDHKLPGQTRTLQAKIDALKQSQAAKQAQTTQAIKDKDLSLDLKVDATPHVVIGTKVIAQEVQRFARLYSTSPGRVGTR